jgi:dephospho-CoA kinase
MIKICVVGEIGSGKTYVSRLFAGNKYPLFNADEEVSKIYSTNKKVFNKLKKIFPRLVTTFPINKLELIKIVLSSINNLKKIIKIIHPEVRKKMNLFLKKNKSKKVVILDIPLLLENKLNQETDVIIFVEANKNLLQKNLEKRIGYNKKIIEMLKKIQLTKEEKKLAADIVVENNFNPQNTRLRVKQVLDRILI